MTRSDNLQRWMDVFPSHAPDVLAPLLDDEAVFHSPVVHTPQKGKSKVIQYLSTAGHVLEKADFKYVREIDNGESAMLEFTCMIDSVFINGVDIIRWNDDGAIVDFKVMVRPLQGINAIHAAMKAAFERDSAR